MAVSLIVPVLSWKEKTENAIVQESLTTVVEAAKRSQPISVGMLCKVCLLILQRTT